MNYFFQAFIANSYVHMVNILKIIFFVGKLQAWFMHNSYCWFEFLDEIRENQERKKNFVANELVPKSPFFSFENVVHFFFTKCLTSRLPMQTVAHFMWRVLSTCCTKPTRFEMSCQFAVSFISWIYSKPPRKCKIRNVHFKTYEMEFPQWFENIQQTK